MSEGGPEGGGRVGARIMAERKQKRYFRLTRSERASIERELGKRRPSARDVARDLGRSPASISDEAKRNRTVARGPGKGERAGDAPCVSSSPSFTKNHRSFQSSSLIFFTNHHGALGAPREAPSRGGEVSCLRRLPYEAAASARMRELRMR